jgi:hypothetical protein
MYIDIGFVRWRGCDRQASSHKEVSLVSYIFFGIRETNTQVLVNYINVHILLILVNCYVQIFMYL